MFSQLDSDDRAVELRQREAVKLFARAHLHLAHVLNRERVGERGVRVTGFLAERVAVSQEDLSRK